MGTDLTGLGEPLGKAVEAIRAAVGTWYEPRQIRRVAQAEADALITRTDAELEAQDRIQRAAHRLLHVEAVRQENIEAIADGALELLPPQGTTETPHTDWMHRFFEACKDVGDEEMQRTWSRILAGEFEQPGRYSYRLLATLRLIKKDEAEEFARFLGSALLFASTPQVGQGVPCVPAWGALLRLAQEHVGDHRLFMLEEAGLVAQHPLQFPSKKLVGMDGQRTPTPIAVTYGVRSLQVTRSRSAATTAYYPTLVGVELSRICTISRSDEYWAAAQETILRQGFSIFPSSVEGLNEYLDKLIAQQEGDTDD